MCLRVSYKKKIYKIIIFCILKVTEERSRIRTWIRFRIRTQNVTYKSLNPLWWQRSRWVRSRYRASWPAPSAWTCSPPPWPPRSVSTGYIFIPSPMRVQSLLKVWWHNATLFCLFVFITYSTDIHSITFIQFTYPSPFAGASLHLLIALKAQWESLPVVPSRESNSGLPYSKPTRYQLSRAAPYWAVPHHTEPCRTIITRGLHGSR